MNRKQVCEAVGKLISEDRNKTHGDPHQQFTVAQAIKEAVAGGARFFHNDITPVEREAIEQICTKISRIVCGSSDQDHYRDIIGYAAIAAEAVQPVSITGTTDTVQVKRKRKKSRR